MTGAAASEWTLDLLFLHSEAQVLQTAQMLREEWRIQVRAPRAVACIRSAYAKAFAAQGVTLVSFKQIPFPRVAPYSTAFRLVTTAATQALVVEIVAIGRSRTSISLVLTGLSRDQAAIHAAALRYARILAGRIRA